MRVVRVLLMLSVIASTATALVIAFRAPMLVVVAGVVVVVVKSRRGAPLWAAGTAKWASAAELDRAGMLADGPGLCIGRVNAPRPRFLASLIGLFDRRIPAAAACQRFVYSMRKLQPWKRSVSVRLNQAVHTAIFAPTGAGKGVSLIVAFLRECRGACVTIDPKGENLKLTSEYRRQMGHRVVALAPFDDATGDTCNPLDLIDENSPTALDDCRAMAKELVVSTGSEPDPHWNTCSEHIIAALLAAILFMPKEHRHLGTLRTLLTDDAKRSVVLGKMRESADWGGMLARVANQVLNWKDKELSGILSTANQHTAFLDSQSVARSVASSSFDPAELRSGKLSVYLCIPPQYLRSHSALLRLFIGTMLRACVKQGLGGDNKVHFILDEAASLGRMESLEDAVDKLRGYSIRCQFYYQSLGQLKTCWRDGLDQSLLSNSTQIYFGVNDFPTAEAVSNLLGEETIIVDNGGSNTGGSTSANTHEAGGNVGRSWGSNRGWAQQARKLLKPEEIIALPQRTAITISPNVRPIATTLTRYYENQPGNAQSRWRRMWTTAEILLTAVCLLFLSSLGVWAAANLVQHPLKHPPAKRAVR